MKLSAFKVFQEEELSAGTCYRKKNCLHRQRHRKDVCLGGEGGGGRGGRKVPALNLNVYNFFKIQPNAAKLYEFF